MALTITRATTNAHLAAIKTLFETKVNGVSIVDEFVADWGKFMPMDLATWGPIMADPNSIILMGSQPANTLRGAGWWHKEFGDTWMVVCIGIDKSLTAQQRLSGFHDFMIALAGQVPPETKYGGIAIVGSSIYNYLTSRLPASRVTDTDNPDQKMIRTTAAETLALL